MGNGEWGMGNGEWGMGNGEWDRVSDKRLLTINLGLLYYLTKVEIISGML
jgi:hypothetical protein